jgi:hypothetical protein
MCGCDDNCEEFYIPSSWLITYARRQEGERRDVEERTEKRRVSFIQSSSVILNVQLQ